MASASISSVEEAITALNKAMLSGDKAEFDKWTADELIYRHAGGRTAYKQQFIEDSARGSLRITDAVISDQTIKLIDNVALADHVFKRYPRVPKKPGDVSTLQVLSVWMLRNGQWKMIARQSFRPQH